MSDQTPAESHTQFLLNLATAGDDGALEALLRHCTDRLTLLARRMLGTYPRVQRWAETGDVLQNALVRLLTALRAVKPQTTRDFLALAALQIRRELLDLTRRYYGPEGLGANQDSATDLAQAQAADRREDPVSLAQWSELHQRIGELPEEEREVVGLVFYQGMTQPEAAEVLGISLRTLQRRWHSALCQLHRLWRGE